MVIIETEDTAGLRDGPSGAPGPVPEPAPPSSADLAADLRLVVGRLARSLRQADDGGLTPSQLSALSSIDALGSVRLGDLAAAERVTSPTLTKIVANLEAAGLVQRSADPDDRRAARVSLTPAGKSRLKRLRTERNAYLQQRLAALSAGGPRDAGGGHRRADHAGRDGPARDHRHDEHLRLAPPVPELPALLRRAGGVAGRHVDADRGPGLAGAAAHRQQHRCSAW